MKTGEISELHLAAVIAIATIVGGVASSAVDRVWLDAGTERQTDVQLVELAIDILRTPVENNFQLIADNPEYILRAWAVDTLNGVSEIKIKDDVRNLMIQGGFDVFAEKDRLLGIRQPLSDEEYRDYIQDRLPEGFRAELNERGNISIREIE